MKIAVECALRPSDINPFGCYFWDFLEESICADTSSPKTIKELKDTNVSERGHLLSEMADKAITDPKNARVLDVILRKTAQMGPFNPTLADGKLRVGATDDIVNLLCHFIGIRMLRHFRKCDFNINTIKQNMSNTFGLDTRYIPVFENSKFFFDFFEKNNLLILFQNFHNFENPR